MMKHSCDCHKAEEKMEEKIKPGIHKKVDKELKKERESKGMKKAHALEKLGKKEKKIEKVMQEFKEDKLHSGSKKGPLVKNKKQALAIALSEARKRTKKK